MLVLSCGLLEVGSTIFLGMVPRARITEIMVFISFGLTLSAALLAGRLPVQGAKTGGVERLFLLVLLVSLYMTLILQMFQGMDIGDRNPEIRKLGAICLAVVCIGIIPYISLLFPAGPKTARVSGLCTPALIAFILGVGCLLKVAGIIYEKQPMIDVWEVMQGGAIHLSQWHNPFASALPKAAALGVGFSGAAPAYVYMPSTLLLSYPAVAWAGDCRYAYVLADLASAILLLLIGRRLKNEGGNPLVARASELAALLVMFHPSSFAKTWNDMLAVPIIFGFILMHLRNPLGKAQAVMAGFMLSLKQYEIFLVVPVAFLLRKPSRLVIAAIAGVATTLPFLIWDAGALYSSLTVHTGVPFRSDGISLGTFLFHLFGMRIPSWIGVASAAALTVASCLYASRRGMVGTLSWGAAILLALFLGATPSSRTITSLSYASCSPVRFLRWGRAPSYKAVVNIGRCLPVKGRVHYAQQPVSSGAPVCFSAAAGGCNVPRLRRLRRFNERRRGERLPGP
jgi:hypothetical protein